MKKIKLSIELINNALEFYTKNLGEVFSHSEVKILNNKLLSIIKYDEIIKNKKLQYELPKNTLYLVYFIGEYKKAYKYALENKRDKNTFEYLGKSFTRKKEEYEKELKTIFNDNVGVNEKFESFFKTTLLLLLKKRHYKKASKFFLGNIYIGFPQIKSYLNQLHKYNTDVQVAIDAIDNSLEYFKYTYLSEGKILNSSFIVIYTTLTQNLKMNENDSFKYAKDLVNIFVDSNNYQTDKYRKSYLTDKDIYCAGIYQGLPIFQWYLPDDGKSYYQDIDIQKMKVINRIIFKKSKMDFTTRFLIKSIIKIFYKKATNKDVNKMYELSSDGNYINSIFLQLHKQFVLMPSPILQYIPHKKSIVLWLVSVFIGIYTKLADFKTKLAKQ